MNKETTLKMIDNMILTALVMFGISLYLAVWFSPLALHEKLGLNALSFVIIALILVFIYGYITDRKPRTKK